MGTALFATPFEGKKMPRPLAPSRPLEVAIDPALRAKLDALLFSESEGRIPYGAYAKFFNRALRALLDYETLDLRPFGIMGAVRGPHLVVDALQKKLSDL